MYIVATISKNSYSPEKIREILEAGADILRFNLSHGTPEEEEAHMRTGRQVAEKLDLRRKVRILADLPGNKLRLGRYEPIEYPVKAGERVLFRSSAVSPDPAEFIPVNFPDIGSMLEAGQIVTLGDGEIGLRVVDIPDRESFVAEALNNRVIQTLKALNIGRAADALDHFTPQTFGHISNLKKIEPEMVAFSFVRSADDLKKGRKLLEAAGAWTSGWNPKIVAKIESPEGVERVDEIAAEADILMVARGDLGLTAPIESLGLHQKKIVAAARSAGKESIVSTQILDSLMEYHVPQRAEVLDLTNIVLDGADGIMLAKETGISRTPGRSVRTARRIIEAVEAAIASGKV